MIKYDWLAKCKHWKDKWPVSKEQPAEDADETYHLNIYTVLDSISQHSSANDVLMGDAGSISYAGPTALQAKQGQRFVFSPAQADMGWALPGAIGVAMASGQQVIAIIGDGSFMSNLQELAVVKQHELNIKFVILNNDGYLSIKNTQSKYFDGRVHGTGSETGLWFPSFKTIAASFKIGYADLRTQRQVELKMSTLLSTPGPMIIDCQCKLEQEILPAQALKNGQQAGLHDLTPFLSADELAKEMITKIS